MNTIYKEQKIRSPLSSLEIKAILQGCVEQFKHYDEVIDVPLDGRHPIPFETRYKVKSLEDHSAELERHLYWSREPKILLSLSWSEGEDGTVIRYRFRDRSPSWLIMLLMMACFTFVHRTFKPENIYFAPPGLIFSLLLCGLILISDWTQRNQANRHFISWTRFSFQTHA